jgi:hypothetical protein
MGEVASTGCPLVIQVERSRGADGGGRSPAGLPILA